ncbi:stage II sporulation protein M [Rubeoparvulum massiliense]|uniref:stage II sporulation protein M n=1 Tax=Rubeoparvulum massiliense TaxID=1631346 RepID=UPI00065E8490|nr:stage II sporulation protein M [Rubeoparvulum massiliense]
MAKSSWQWMNHHFGIVIFTLILLLSGVVFGAILFQRLFNGEQGSIGESVAAYLAWFEGEQGWNSWEIARNTLTQQGILLFALGIVGLTVIGLPLLLIALFLKGATIGFTVATLTQQFQWQGVLMAGASILPHNLILLPAWILVTVIGIHFSFQLLKVLFLKRTERIAPHFRRFTVAFGVALLFVVGAALVEGFISTTLLHWTLAH